MKGNKVGSGVVANPMDTLALCQLRDLQVDIVCLAEINVNWNNKEVWAKWILEVKKCGGAPGCSKLINKGQGCRVGQELWRCLCCGHRQTYTLYRISQNNRTGQIHLSDTQRATRKKNNADLCISDESGECIKW